MIRDKDEKFCASAELQRFLVELGVRLFDYQ